MPRKKSEKGWMLKNAAKFWHDSISASVPHCLRAAKFTNQEAVDRALQAADETAETMHLLKKCNVFMARGRARKLG